MTAFMPIVSKYSPKQQDKLLEQVLSIFEDQEIPVDLCLMTLGNAVSNVIARGYPTGKQSMVAEQFARVLLQSVQPKKTN